MTPAFRIQDTSITDVGKVRSENEDSHVDMPREGVWLVADGMGGHYNGRFASQAITSAVGATAMPDDIDQAWDAVAGAIHQANGLIFEKSQTDGRQMGSTVVALVVRGHEFVVLWAGDSRAYLYRDGHLIQLTRDHTQVEAMVERGLLNPDEAADHPMKHVLARAVGVQETLELDAIKDQIVARDVFLLCSDGLTGVLSDAEIAAYLREHDLVAGERMVAACLDRGAPDNVTITLVSASEPTLLVLNGARA